MKNAKKIELIGLPTIILILLALLFLVSTESRNDVSYWATVLFELVIFTTILACAAQLYSFVAYFKTWKNIDTMFVKLLGSFTNSANKKWVTKLYENDETAHEKFILFCEESLRDTGFFSTAGCTKRADIMGEKLIDYLSKTEPV